MTRAENYVTLEFLSRSSNEGFARIAAAGFAAQLDPTLDELGDIKTAVSEAVTNAIVHAYPDQLGKVVMKLKILKGGVLEITIRDWGRSPPHVYHRRQRTQRNGLYYHGELHRPAGGALHAGKGDDGADA